MAKKADKSLPIVVVNNQKGTQPAPASRVSEYQIVDGRFESDTNSGVIQ